MHQISFEKVTEFKDKYLSTSDKLKIVDLYGLSIKDMSTKAIFNEKKWKHEAISIKNANWFDKIKDKSVDAVVTAQTIERVEEFWLVWNEIERILSPGGYLCIIAASAGAYAESGDFYRFNPKILIKLAELNGLEVLDCIVDQKSTWHEATLIAKKPGKKEKEKEVIVDEDKVEPGVWKQEED